MAASLIEVSGRDVQKQTLKGPKRNVKWGWDIIDRCLLCGSDIYFGESILLSLPYLLWSQINGYIADISNKLMVHESFAGLQDRKHVLTSLEPRDRRGIVVYKVHSEFEERYHLS